MAKRAPLYLKKYFWDIDFTRFDPQKYPRMTLERILDLGDKKAVHWAFKNFSRQKIIDALCLSRQISQKSANFWSLFLGVPKEKIRCFQPQSPSGYKRIWPY